MCEASVKQNAILAQPWPFPPSIIEWIGTSIDADKITSFPTLLVFVSDRQEFSGNVHYYSNCRLEVSKLTPRTIAITEYIHQIKRAGCGPAQDVETMARCRISNKMMETFPEAIVASLQQSIVKCQSDPPTRWDKSLLKLISREDMIIEPHATLDSGQDGSSIIVSYKRIQEEGLKLSDRNRDLITLPFTMFAQSASPLSIQRLPLQWIVISLQ